MDSDAMTAMWVELSEAFQAEFTKRIIEFISFEKKNKRWWKRALKWLGSIRYFKCICGSSGIGFECERPKTPPPMPPQRLPVIASSSLSGFTQVTAI